MVRIPKIKARERDTVIDANTVASQYFIERANNGANNTDFTLKQALQISTQVTDMIKSEHDHNLEQIQIQFMTPIGVRNVFTHLHNIQEFIDDVEEYFRGKVKHRGKFEKVHSIYIKFHYAK